MAIIFILFLNAGMFAIMGIISIVSPNLTTSQFGVKKLNRDGRNEVRSVYGGYGLAMASVLIAAACLPDIRSGVALTVGLALCGMVAGRVLSALIDKGIGHKPMFYLTLELVLAILLLTI